MDAAQFCADALGLELASWQVELLETFIQSPDANPIASAGAASPRGVRAAASVPSDAAAPTSVRSWAADVKDDAAAPFDTTSEYDDGNGGFLTGSIPVLTARGER